MGCSSTEPAADSPDVQGWDGTMRQWGTLREVMHGEILDGQIQLAQVTGESHVYGIGAPAKLNGEILIADSAAWVAEVSDGRRVETHRSQSPEDSAVFLAIARVPRWMEVEVPRDVPPEKFDDFIGEEIHRASLDRWEDVPFVIEGRFSTLDLHVLNGQCPFADPDVQIEGAGPPLRTEYGSVSALLVGFYSENGAGRITHHGTRTHVHALVKNERDGDSPRPLGAGHVDAVALKSGTVLRLPVASSTATRSAKQ